MMTEATMTSPSPRTAKRRVRAGQGSALTRTTQSIGSLVLVLAVLALVMETLGWLNIKNGMVFIPLSEAATAAGALITSTEYLENAVAPTVSAALISLALSLVLGTLIGLAVWRWPLARRIIDPYLSILPALPLITLYPMLIVIMGTGLVPLLLVAVLAGFVPVATQTIAGLSGLSETHVRLAAALRMPPLRRLRLIYLPSLARPLLTGTRLAAAFSLIAVISSQMILSTNGLGRRIRTAYDSFDLAGMYGSVLVVFGLIAILYGGLWIAERSILRWE